MERSPGFGFGWEEGLGIDTALIKKAGLCQPMFGSNGQTQPLGLKCN